jgi:predicted nuclease of predicted toxin-antitoxin system
VKRFLVDAQLPPALARWLAAAGREAEHVADVGLGDASDRTIWNYALAAGAVIISKDEDFSQRKALGDEGPAIVWIRLRNTRRRLPSPASGRRVAPNRLLTSENPLYRPR